MTLLVKEAGIAGELAQSSISDGVLHALALLVALEGDSSGILAIEEPENAIHPWSVSEIVRLAQERSIQRQTLLTTHSPVVVDAVADPDSLYLVESKGTGGTTVIPARAAEHSIDAILRESGQELGAVWVDGSPRRSTNLGSSRLMPTRPSRTPRERTVGLVVEGPTEYLALPLIYQSNMVPSCAPLRASHVGGFGEMEPRTLALRALPKVIAHQAAERSPIVVCLDRERRAVEPERLARQILEQLKAALRERGRHTTNIHVIVADRAFEAWILADALGLFERRIFVARPTFHCFEGELGDRSLLGVVELDRSLGRSYGKRTDGPRLFKEISLAAARMHGPGHRGSRSLDQFLRALGV